MITILAHSNNERGDVFARLVSDIFYSLGYEQLRFNIHQTGREVDVIGSHCTENRVLVAECKATEAPIGGRDLNTFSGVLEAEKIKNGGPIAGYFASVSGFTESAIQQEKDLGNRFTMLGPKEITSHLIRGRIVANEAYAASQASKFLEADAGMKFGNLSLLAHHTGWYWLATFTNAEGNDTSYSIVHADGFVLAKPRGEDLAISLTHLNGLEYAGPSGELTDNDSRKARKQYIEYLVKEYGYITLEGLPADQEVGSRSLRLENIFVPLSLERVTPEVLERAADDPESGAGKGIIRKVDEEDSLDAESEVEEEGFVADNNPHTKSRKKSARELAGRVLASNSRLAIVGSPGSGKTTLLKRLAVAYASPSRRKESKDELPQRDWFPVAIRCRHLGVNASSPILKGIEELADRAEMPELRDAFRECVSTELRAGRVLLLIDGLDEISSPSQRSAYVSQLRTFLGTYPSVSLVVTSREFGFRAVAGAVATVCTTYRVAELSNEDVKSITLAWHKEVVGSGIRVVANASELAEAILRTDRVRRLALNPLLLTTLLLVRRWLGELPRKRSVLYAKAIEVLLMTWNVEGHQPLDPDEALPQLAFAAFCMMQQNVQSVSIKELTGYFSEARRQMPELLGYSRLSVSEFVSRVEERSSLLSLSGHIIEDGQLRATYEFKHLTFQEYLAALAAAEGYYPDRRDGEELVDVLAPYLTKASWREVIPLSGVLGGRASAALIERIIDLIGPPIDWRILHRRNSSPSNRRESLVSLLAQCLTDEVPLARETLRKAINIILTRTRHPAYGKILSSRYGPEVYEVARTECEQLNEFCYSFGGAWAQAARERVVLPDRSAEEIVTEIISLIKSPDITQRIEGCLIAMELFFHFASTRRIREFDSNRSYGLTPTQIDQLRGRLRSLSTAIIKLQDRETDPRVIFAGFWALAWSTGSYKPTENQASRLLNKAWAVWQESPHSQLRRQCAWLIWRLPILPRERVELEVSSTTPEFLEAEISSGDWMSLDHYHAALTIGYYLRSPWSDARLIRMAQDENRPISENKLAWQKAYLNAFGKRGAAATQTNRSTSTKKNATRA